MTRSGNWNCLTGGEKMSYERERWFFVTFRPEVYLRTLRIVLDTLQKNSLEENDQVSACLLYAKSYDYRHFPDLFCFFSKHEVRVIRETEYVAT